MYKEELEQKYYHLEYELQNKKDNEGRMELEDQLQKVKEELQEKYYYDPEWVW